MDSFERAFRGLNKKQLEAVKTIEGPVLVIAGPGTGKTQLISARAGHILKSTDTLPQNILCVTFSEAGATAMRERLSELLGQEAYEIQISTYHSFGNELMRRNPEYFDEYDIQSIDELGAINLIQELVRRLPYGNAMKFMEDNALDVLNFISESKKALLSPEDIVATAEANIKFINLINKKTGAALKKLTTVSKKTANLFASMLLEMEAATDSHPPPSGVKPISILMTKELKMAVSEFTVSGSTKPLTHWKNAWLAKDKQGNFIIAGLEQNRKLIDAGMLYGQYQLTLRRRKLYDYDDMILRVIEAMEKSPEFKYSVAEQFLYIMLDEFQDTNPAQFKLIKLLTDHPILEKKPNILAVGDDDQAIYAFQGAEQGNMLEFARYYREVKVISLEENYRSTAVVIETGQNIAAQIEDRLYKNFAGIDKKLVPASKPAFKTEISYREFKSDAAQYSWVADEIERLCKKAGILPGEVAVLATKHRFLTPLLPHLARRKLPVRYEKRENILDVPPIRQLEQMSRLVMSLADNDLASADSLWPEILSYDFWGLSTEKIWQLSWQARQDRKPWIELLMKDLQTKYIVLFFLRLKDLLETSTLQQQLDGLIGADDISQILELPVTSPYFNYYFGDKAQAKDPVEFVSLLSNLSLLKNRLREWRADEEHPLNLRHFIDFLDAHREADLSIIDSSPYNESEQAVNLMTAYAAKGREFEAVFIMSAQDNVWGPSSRTQSSRISLPANLRFMRYQGASEDERIRLLYVAVTRAKTRLYFTGYQQSLAGRPSSRLKYLDVIKEEKILKSRALPKGFETLIEDGAEALPTETVIDYWLDRHSPPFKPSLKRLLKKRLDKFQLSPSGLNLYTNVAGGGPRAFFINSILGFPAAPTISSIYGSIIHEAVRWYLTASSEDKKPEIEELGQRFEQMLRRQKLPEESLKQLLVRGRTALERWAAQSSYKPGAGDKFEYNFRNEGVFSGDALLSGKVDWLRLNPKSKTAVVIDFKTGQAYRRWNPSVIKLHQFRQQLQFYKLLVEGSASFKGYKVEKGIVEFVEPDADGEILQLELLYNEQELNDLKHLIENTWGYIHKMEWPDISGYSLSASGIRQFEKDLALGKVKL